MTDEFAINILEQYREKPTLINEIETVEEAVWLDEALAMGIQALKQKSCEDMISRQAVDTLVDELARAISDERCCILRGRSTATIMQDILDLPSVKPQEPQTEWIPIEWKPFGKNGYPKPEDEYKHFLTIDDKGEITIQEFLLSLDEEPQPYFTGMRKIIAWMPLPKPYKGEYDG